MSRAAPYVFCLETSWAQYEPRRPVSRCRGQGVDPASWPGALEQRLKSRPSCGGLLLVPPKQATGDDVSCGCTWRQRRVQWRRGAPTNAAEQRQQVECSTIRGGLQRLLAAGVNQAVGEQPAATDLRDAGECAACRAATGAGQARAAIAKGRRGRRRRVRGSLCHGRTVWLHRVSW